MARAEQQVDIPSIQGYLAQKKTPPPQGPTVGLCLGPYGGPRGMGVSL